MNGTPAHLAPYLSPADERLVAAHNDRPRGALGIVVRDHREVLLNLRDNKPAIVHPNKWSVLGGLCEPDEDEPAALVRELAEEAGLGIAGPEPFCRLVDAEGSGHLLTAFIVRVNIGLRDLVLGEGQEMRFFSPAAARNLDLVPFARRLLTVYFEGLGTAGARGAPVPGRSWQA